MNYFSSEKSLQGYECPCVVLVADRIKGLHNNKLFSRCISDLILVFQEEQAQKLSLDVNIAQIIPVYGECFSLIKLSNSEK